MHLRRDLQCPLTCGDAPPTHLLEFVMLRESTPQLPSLSPSSHIHTHHPCHRYTQVSPEELKTENMVEVEMSQ